MYVCGDTSVPCVCDDDVRVFVSYCHSGVVWLCRLVCGCVVGCTVGTVVGIFILLLMIAVVAIPFPGDDATDGIAVWLSLLARARSIMVAPTRASGPTVGAG